MSIETSVRYPVEPNERVCATCEGTATSVINDIPQCDEHAGLRIIDDHPEVLGMLLSHYLRGSA